MDNNDTITPRIPTSWDNLKRRILSGLGEIAVSIFGGLNPGGFSQAIINKIKNNFHNLLQKQILQS